MENSFDLIVLGAGSGGLAAAKRAASHGAKVAIVEADRVGGTCVIRGCVPKKLLLYGSLYKDYISNALSFGVDIQNSSINSEILLGNVRKEVDRLNNIHIGLLRKYGVQLISGWGSFLSQHRILVKSNDVEVDDLEIYGKRILIAVGGEAKRPNIPGADLGWISDDIFEQKKFPKNIVVVGAGYIACEFSCILNNLGVKVTHLVRSKNLLKDFDKDLTSILKRNMLENGINLVFGTYPVSIYDKNDIFCLETNHGQRIDCESVLFAIGRKPKIDHLNLDASGIELENGKVTVSDRHCTNIEHIFAIGDVTNKFNLTPVAVDEGRAFADYLFAGKQRKVNYNLIPSAVFCQPEIACVGLTEQESISIYGIDNIQIFKAKFKPMSLALTKSGASCLLKLIVEKDTNKVVGCHMIGEHAAEIIQMASIALGMGATKLDFDRTMALHPTVAEEFVTML